MKKENISNERSNTKYPQISRDFDSTCPKCGSINVFARTRKKPKYKCKYCDYEFDNTKNIIEYKTVGQKRGLDRQYYFPED